ncbi:MAG: DUF6504 family protein [Phycisphaerae bacterium]
MDEQFISEPIKPVEGTFDTGGMARGEPGLPQQFTWRGEKLTVVRVLESWKKSGREGHSSKGELYLRRHYYRLETTCGKNMTVYFERQARPATSARKRWFLYSLGR